MANNYDEIGTVIDRVLSYAQAQFAPLTGEDTDLTLIVHGEDLVIGFVNDGEPNPLQATIARLAHLRGRRVRAAIKTIIGLFKRQCKIESIN